MDEEDVIVLTNVSPFISGEKSRSQSLGYPCPAERAREALEKSNQWNQKTPVRVE